MASAFSAFAARFGWVVLALVFPVGFAGCGAEDGGQNPVGDGSAPAEDRDGGCLPLSLSGWAPTWRPPRPPLTNACTEAQIEQRYAACEDALTADTATCRAFAADPANAKCQACLFSNEGDSSYGPIILLRNKSWRTNTPGCIALVDGDLGTTGCGAKLQAVSACYDAACVDACVSFSSFVQCRNLAIQTVCRRYHYDAVCEERPVYSICTEYATSRDFYLAVANFFCATGLPPSGLPPPRNGRQ